MNNIIQCVKCGWLGTDEDLEAIHSEDVPGCPECGSYDLDEPELDEESDLSCDTCRGTGIGQHGDPDTSICADCGGSCVRREA